MHAAQHSLCTYTVHLTRWLSLLAILLGIGLSACSEKTDTETPKKNIDNASAAAKTAPIKTTNPTQKPTYIEQGDLEALQKHGELRLIRTRNDNPDLSREGLPSHEYQTLAEKFAQRLGLKAKWVYVDELAEQIPALLAGKGDIVASYLTETQSRKKDIHFSLPLGQTEDQVVNAKNSRPIEIIADLKGKHIAVPTGSSYIDSLSALSQAPFNIEFTLEQLDKNADPEQLIDLVVAGKYDATVLDSALVDSLLAYRDDIQRGVSISPVQSIAWGLRKSSPKLLSALNQYLTESRILKNRHQRRTEDFDTIKAEKSLRVITRNNPATYFLWRGELMGFEYELMTEFAKTHALRLELVVAPPGVDMITWLKEGRGDVVAAAMTVTEKRQNRGVTFTRKYNQVNEQIISHSQGPAIKKIEDLNGRTLTLNPKHAYWKTAERIQAQGIDFTLQPAPVEMSSTDILAKISVGELDATIIDSHRFAIENNFLENLSPGLLLAPARAHAWIVRKNNAILLRELNAFIKKNYRGLLFNIINNKYYKNTKRIDRYQGQRLSKGEALSLYDDIVKPLAEQYHLDWRLIISQMYQESQFDPSAISFAGALGLLQVMPRTAAELGYELPLSPEQGIHAGITYLNWARDRFESHLPIEERLWFALAAYNAGFGHVNDARRLARKKGWNGDKWFGHVEKAMLLLAQKKYHQHARFGYVRGTEPVHYVQSIRTRYQAYLAL